MSEVELSQIDVVDEWKPIIGYEGLYEVSNMGQVRSVGRLVRHRFGKAQRKGLVLVQEIDKAGYCKAGLSKNNCGKNFFIHRLVAIHFIPNPLNLPEVNHKKCNKLDNRASELEWITPKGNIQHAIKHGRGIGRRKLIIEQPKILAL